jgi:ABC-type polar amino acid transport system ATPase subunit
MVAPNRNTGTNWMEVDVTRYRKPGTGRARREHRRRCRKPVDGGTITFEGQSVRARTKEVVTIRRRIGMIFQNFNLYPHLTALENVMLAPVRVLGHPKQEVEARARELFRKVRLEHRALAYPGQLSGGEQQRVAIARALAMGPHLMLFDEPTSALDPETVGDVLRVMEDIAREGRTMLVVTHEIDFACHVGTRMIFMDGGKILEDRPPEEMIADPNNARTKQFLSSILQH